MLFNSLEKLKTILPECLNFKDTAIEKFQFDSRSVQKGDVFIALKDVRDGHDFVPSSIENGAVACIVSKTFPGLNIPQFVVEDTWESLNNIATECRAHYKGKVIAVTGSAGKTTTSHMIKSCLENSYSTYKNYNGLLGLPITLAHLNQDSDFAVLELGTDAMGNIDILTNFAKPDIAIVTSVGPAHLEHFKTIENIAKEKLSIANGLSENGTLIIPHEYKDLAQSITDRNTLSIDVSNAQANCFAKEISSEKIIARINNKEITFRLEDISEHRVYNSLMTLCILDCLGFDIESKKTCVENFTPLEGRGERIDLLNNITLIDESYNANPLSMQKSLQAFENSKAENKIAIIADMLELGDNEVQLHKNLISYCKKIKTIYTVGALMHHLHKDLIENSLSTQHFDSAEQLLDFLKSQSLSNCEILIKGSNSTKVSNAVDFLTQEYKK